MKKEKKTGKPIKEKAVILKPENSKVTDVVVKKPGVSLFGRIRAVLFTRTAALICLMAVMLLSLFATMRDSFIGQLQSDFLTRINAPFYKIHVAHLFIDYTPYFLLNLIVIFACLSLLFFILAGKSGAARVTYKKIISTGTVFLAAAVIYSFQVKFFLADKFYITQGILYLSLVILLGIYFYRADRAGSVPVFEGRLLEPAEKRNLFLFAAAMFVMYIWDYRSWKYCFIGDEYMFYTFAKNVASGAIPLKFFYETGVAGDHPVMASIYTAAVMKIFGTGLFGWKMNAAIVPVVTVIPLYIWLKMIFKKKVAMIASAAFIFSAAMMAFARIPHDVIHAVFPFVLTFLLIELAIRKNSRFWSFAAGVVMALGCYSFYPSRLTALVAALYWFFHPLRRKYAVSNLITGLAIYAATVAFIFLNPAFADHMLVHSVFKGSEIGNAADRPLYMVMNYIITFFAFLYKPNMSHFIAGSTADWLTAIGALAGLLWCFMSFKKDWRARWLLLSYAVLVVFIGAIVQYSYAPNTRVNFLAPMFAILAGVGLTRIIAAFSGAGKKPYTGYKILTYAVTVMVMLSALWYFYVYSPKVFPFTPESYIVKYMEEKAQKGKQYRMVTGEFIRDTLLPELYKFPKGFACMGSGDFEKMLADESAKNKIFIFSRKMMEEKDEMKGIVKKGSTIYGYEGSVAAYVFDFTDPRYFDGFKQLWTTGKTFLDTEEPEVPPSKAGEKAVPIKYDMKESVKIKKNVRTKFTTGVFYRNMTSSIITGYEAAQLRLGAGLGSPSDIAVSPDGLRLYVAEGASKKILIFSSKDGLNYSLEKAADFYPEKKSIFGFSGAPANKGEKYLYICLDGTGGFMALDPDRGCARLFNGSGTMIREVISTGILVGARSLRLSPTGIMAAAAVPSQNMVFIFTASGEPVSNLVTGFGSGLGQFSGPTFMEFGGSKGFFVVDSGNGRIQNFDDNFNYIQFYRIGTLPQVFAPQMLLRDDEKVPYFIVLQPLYKRLLLYPLKEDRIRMLELSDIKGVRLTAPSMLSQDAKGSIYIMDHKEKTILKLTLPKDAIKAPPRVPGQSG